MEAFRGDIGTDALILGGTLPPTVKDQGAIDELVPGCPVTVLPNNGSTSGNERAPNSNFIGGRAVYLITAAEVAASGLQSGAVPGAIGWHYSTASGVAPSGTLIVYLQNTTDVANLKSTTWATAISGMTIVHNAATTLPSTTSPFDITFAGGSSFTYTGGGLYVAFDWQWPGPTTTTGVVACTTTLTGGLLGANQTTPTPPTVIGPASAFRPETRLTPAVGFANDVGVDQVMSPGALPNGLVGAQAVQAVVTNKGTTAKTNLLVSLNITGAESFSNTQTVASLPACGGQATVTFAGWTPTTLGSDNVAVSVPADDNNPNNSKSKPLSVTANRYSYKYPGSTASGGVGFTGATGQFVGRFNTTALTQVDAVTVEFFATGATAYRIAIYADAGGVPGAQLYEDAADRTVAAAGSFSIRLPAPVAVGPGNFYVGIEQTNITNASYSFDGETPLRLGVFFLSAVPAAAWTDFAPANGFKLNIGATLGACLVPLSVDVTPNAASACAGGSILFTCNATGGTPPFTFQWTENGIDIGGATSATFSATKAAAGAFTYNCKVSDDGGCNNVQDGTASTGTWIATGGTCQDGNPCTGPDTCAAGGVCSPGPNPCNDSNACTNDICDGQGGCSYTNVDCNDNNVCTADGCNPGTGCTHAPVAGPCSDGNVCTVGDACSGGTCVPGPTPTPVQFCNTGAITINDGSQPTPATPYPSTIAVSGLNAILCSSQVILNGFSHTFPDDVDILLAAPAGQNAIILSDVGGGIAAVSLGLTLDDSAGAPLPDAGPLATGTFKPTNVDAGATGTEAWPAPAPAPLGGSALSVFNGSSPNGNWNLFVVDDENLDSGSIGGGWCLNLAAAPCVTSADCNDNNVCTVDTCSNGACSHVSTDCSDPDACTQDNCDPVSGLCEHPPTNCDDNNACTTDSCNSQTGCAHVTASSTVTHLKIGTTCTSGCTDKHSIVWDAIAGGSPYDTIYGDLQILHVSGLAASTGGCLSDNIAAASSDDVDSPAADQGFWYLVRGRACGLTGTYDEGGNQVAPRDPLIPAPPTDCSRP